MVGDISVRVDSRADRVGAELARATLEKLDAVADHLVGDIHADNYQYLDVVRDADLWSSCRDNIERVLQLIGHCVPDGVDPYDAARETGRRRAEQRATLESVLRSFRVGGRVVWSSALAEARSRDIEPDVLLDVATSVWTVVDQVSSSLSESYRSRELEWLRVDEQRRQELLSELFCGSGDDPVLADEVLRALRLPLGGPYVVVAVDGEPGNSEVVSAPRLECLLGRDGIVSAWQRHTTVTVGLVVLADRSLTDVSAALRDVPARVGVSSIVERCVYIPQARELALTALRTIPLGNRGIALLDERLPQAMVARLPELAQGLITRTLNPLLAQPEEERDALLRTLSTWLRNDCSAKATASRLYCHRNTVLNRLSKIETLVGFSIHGTESAVWLSLALCAWQLRDSHNSA